MSLENINIFEKCGLYSFTEGWNNRHHFQKKSWRPLPFVQNNRNCIKLSKEKRVITEKHWAPDCRPEQNGLESTGRNKNQKSAQAVRVFMNSEENRKSSCKLKSSKNQTQCWSLSGTLYNSLHQLFLHRTFQ